MKTKHDRRSVARQSAAVGLIVLCLLVLTAVSGQAEPVGNLTVSFINVGQGDAALLQDPAGFDVLIDGGKGSQGAVVLDYLRAAGVTDLDVLVASHADADHVGGLIDVLQASDIPVKAVVYNGYESTTTTWANFMAAVAAEGLTPTVAQFPQVHAWGGMSAHVLNPLPGLTETDTNDASVVLRIDYGDFNLLFTGDIPEAVESEVAARGTPLAAEVLKVAHHGSGGSSSAAFLAAVGAADSVISVGQNTYGHPHPEVLARLLQSGSTVWRTDRNGNVVIVSDGISYSLSPQFIPYLLYLPLISKNTPVPWTATVTVVTVTVEPTPVTPTPPPTTGNVRIVSIFPDGTGSYDPDEFVEIQNQDSVAVQIGGWTLRDIVNRVYTFPSFVIQPNA